MNIWDLFGLILLGFSLIQTNMVKLRIFSVITCIFYIVYSVVISNYPLVWPNLFIASIHLYELGKVIKNYKG